jgi:hypothetical protein
MMMNKKRKENKGRKNIIHWTNERMKVKVGKALCVITTITCLNEIV